MSIVCTGSIAYDYLMSFPGYFKDHIMPEHLESISLSFLVDSMVKQKGGTAPNIAYTLALLGERPIVLGTVGEDFADYRAWLDSKNVDTSHIKVIEGKFTASFFANTDLSNAQICSFYTGAMAYACELSLTEFKPDLPQMVIISPNDPGAMYCMVEECIQYKIPYLYDPSQQIVRLESDRLIQGVEGAQSLFLNEYEFELIQKHTGMSVKDIKNNVEFLVVTCGDKGSKIYVDDSEFSVPVVVPKQIVDPTGVGDAFRAGFVRGYRLGLSWETCGRMGALAASYCLEQSGTLNHTYTIEEFISRFKSIFPEDDSIDKLKQ